MSRQLQCRGAGIALSIVGSLCIVAALAYFIPVAPVGVISYARSDSFLTAFFMWAQPTLWLLLNVIAFRPDMPVNERQAVLAEFGSCVLIRCICLGLPAMLLRDTAANLPVFPTSQVMGWNRQFAFPSPGVLSSAGVVAVVVCAGAYLALTCMFLIWRIRIEPRISWRLLVYVSIAQQVICAVSPATALVCGFLVTAIPAPLVCGKSEASRQDSNNLIGGGH